MFSDPHAAISWGFIDGAIIDEIVQTKEKGMLKLYLFLYKMDKVKTLRQFSGINFSLQKIENEGNLPSYGTLRNIIQLFSIDANYLFYDVLAINQLHYIFCLLSYVLLGIY